MTDSAEEVFLDRLFEIEPAFARDLKGDLYRLNVDVWFVAEVCNQYPDPILHALGTMVWRVSSYVGLRFQCLRFLHGVDPKRILLASVAVALSALTHRRSLEAAAVSIPRIHRRLHRFFRVVGRYCLGKCSRESVAFMHRYLASLPVIAPNSPESAFRVYEIHLQDIARRVLSCVSPPSGSIHSLDLAMLSDTCCTNSWSAALALESIHAESRESANLAQLPIFLRYFPGPVGDGKSIEQLLAENDPEMLSWLLLPADPLEAPHG